MMMIAAQSVGTGAAIGAAAVLIVIPIVLVIVIAPMQRKRFQSGRGARFRSPDGIVREGTIVGFGKGRRVRVRDNDGTEYELRPTRIQLL